jgi:16S rRNA A1518/A1519 N6-dimethyltransferase RsmA/KsgA/DIM1 with predicted DNA glycosylase/AP lyase activity
MKPVQPSPSAFKPEPPKRSNVIRLRPHIQAANSAAAFKDYTRCLVRERFQQGQLDPAVFDYMLAAVFEP